MTIQDPSSTIDTFRSLVSDDQPSKDSSTLQIQAGALIARLKALNRTTNAAAQAHRLATAQARVEMDQAHLGLQNLLYEKRHLEREIEKCRQFASIYQDIPMNTIEEFMVLAPEAARTDEVLEDEHQLMVNRLNFELAERLRLEKKRQELAAQREEMTKESKGQQAKADSVKAEVDRLMKSAAEVQKAVESIVKVAPS